MLFSNHLLLCRTMQFYIILSVVSLNLDFVAAATNEDNSAAKVIPTASNQESWDGNQINSFWWKRPISGVAVVDEEPGTNRMVIKQPHSVTRLAKTLTYGLHPQFQKLSFEPFERRPKPVTLVGIRKNGLFPRKNINMVDKSTEIAELQSPFNDISNFWVDETGSSS